MGCLERTNTAVNNTAQNDIAQRKEQSAEEQGSAQEGGYTDPQRFMFVGARDSYRLLFQ